MKEQILFNPDNSCDDICRTIKTTYHKISTANLIRGGLMARVAYWRWRQYRN